MASRQLAVLALLALLAVPGAAKKPKGIKEARAMSRQGSTGAVCPALAGELLSWQGWGGKGGGLPLAVSLGGARAGSATPLKAPPYFTHPSNGCTTCRPPLEGTASTRQGVAKPLSLEDDGIAAMQPRKGRVPPKYIMMQCRRSYRPRQYIEAGAGASSAGVGPAAAAVIARQHLLGARDSAALRELMHGLAGKHLVFLGDSVLRQITLALMCAFSEAGLRPSNVTFSKKTEMQAVYPNGLVVSRWAMTKVSWWHSKHLEEQLGAADLVVASTGRHYPFASKRAEYQRAVELLAKSMSGVLGGRGVLLDMLPAHFPTPSGDFTDPRGRLKVYRSGRVGYVCKGFSDKKGASWQNDAMAAAAAAHGVPVVEFSHVLRERWDAHMGWDEPGGKGARKYLDCVHWCWSPSLFQPLLSRLLSALRTALACPPPARELLYKGLWERFHSGLPQQQLRLPAAAEGGGQRQQPQEPEGEVVFEED
eukprot:CAMPEP_0117657322 /NCGR_PEP_ID=MMETSP0804-20121206/5268_1 /TAXON_ID=1074897 /ORGANISM="Tetraselmis astigmatica, Strain CCMP880" /LENGTH=477 /DNA_ID=CAMNT_0005463767 /DNA_START=170 /DNA_END=1604 /DNA_ORIENTATION=-